MDFSKYKFQEGIATGTGTMPSMTASNNSSIGAQNGAFRAKEQQLAGRTRQETRLSTQRPMRKESEDYNKQLIKEKGLIKAYESKKSDWREELQEKVVDGQERQQHPYVTVMPTGDENLIQAIEQMGKTVKKKKEAVEEGYKKLPKKRMGFKAGKSILKSVTHAAKAGGNTDERNTEAQIESQKADKEAKRAEKIHKVAKNHKPELSKLKSVKNKLKGLTKKEEVEQEEELTLEEDKKKCKEGYKYDSKKKKCVKKKKKSSSSKKTTVIIGRPIYGGGHHHHHDDDHDGDNEGSGGESGGSGSDAGGMGEMFDLLGDMLIEDKMTIKQQMEFSRNRNAKKVRPKNPGEANRIANQKRTQKAFFDKTTEKERAKD